MPRTVGRLLGELLAGVGAARVWGEPLAGLDGVAAVEVRDDPDLAVLLADADGRIGGGVGAAVVSGAVLHLSSRPGGTAAPRTVTDADSLVAAFAELPADHLPVTAALHLDLDLTAPAPEGLAPPLPDRGVVVTLDPSFATARVVVVAGPGVTRGGHGAELRALAASTGWTVVNSWGAKGVLPWFDDHHAGTAGLQAGDLELMGTAEADLVIAVGLDPDEVGVDDLGSALVQEVPAWQLPALTARWDRIARAAAPRPPLYERVAAVVGPMYDAATVPLAPPRAALHLAGARPEGGLVVGERGLAGFWLARSFPTREPGSVVVPATHHPGFAAAAALAAGTAGRPCVAVVDQAPAGGVDEATSIVLEAAASLGVAVAVQAWGPAGSLADADAHALGTEAQFGGAASVVEVPVRDGDLGALVAAAGPVRAWGGLES